MEVFMNKVRQRLVRMFDPDDVNIIMKELCIAGEGFKIEPIGTDMIKWKPELPECYKAYIVTRKLEGTADGTIELYKRYIEDFLMKCTKPMDKISANDIRAYLWRVQEERGISSRTLDGRRSALSAFFNWAAGNEWIEKNPCAGVKPIKYTEEPRRPLTETELEMIRGACESKRDRAMVEFMYSTACRVGELAILKLSDINFSTGEVRLFGKGSKYRSSYLSESAAMYLRNYLESRNGNSEFVFCSLRAPFNGISREAIERAIHDIGIRSGVTRLHPHLFRHSAATHCLRRGMDVTVLREMLGHTSLDTTMIYAKVDKTSVQESHRKYMN